MRDERLVHVFRAQPGRVPYNNAKSKGNETESHVCSSNKSSHILRHSWSPSFSGVVPASSLYKVQYLLEETGDIPVSASGIQASQRLSIIQVQRCGGRFISSFRISTDSTSVSTWTTRSTFST